MARQVEHPPDRQYLYAKSGYNLFVAGYTLVRKIQGQQELRNEDLINYLTSYCDYLLSSHDYSGYLPNGIELSTLQNTDTVLRRTSSRWFLTYPIPGRAFVIASLLRGINDAVVLLLRSRASEMEMTINHMRMEEVDTHIDTLNNPHYLDLLVYHRDLSEKVEVVEFNMVDELNGIYRLLELAGYSEEI